MSKIDSKSIKDHISKETIISPLADEYLALSLASVRSEETRKNRQVIIHNFMKFHNFKTPESVIKTNPKKLTKMIIGYILELSDRVSPNTIPTYLNSIKSFLEINDVELPWKKIKKFYPRKVKISGQSTYSTEDVKTMLKLSPKLRNIALLHFLASTGCRSGAIPSLNLNNVRDMPHGCQMVTIYEDDIEEYKTFLTPEANTALQHYLNQRRRSGEFLTGSSPLFTNLNGDRCSYSSIQQVVNRAVIKGHLRGKTKNGRFQTQICHGFRKRFNTIMKLNNDVNDNAIEKMMGHKNGLDGVYLQIKDEQLFEEFYKGVPDLAITDEYRDKAEIEKLKEEVPESYQQEMLEMKHQMLEMSKRLESLTDPDREFKIQKEWEQSIQNKR